MTNLTLSHQTPITTETIANALRSDILQGIYTSNTPLRQDEIAARFGVSKIPVREALQQLKAEGLVTFYPNRGRWFRPCRALRLMKSTPCVLPWRQPPCNGQFRT